MDGIFCKFCNIKVKNRLLYCTKCLQINEIYCCKTPKQIKLDLCKRCFKVNRKFCKSCNLKIVLPYEYPVLCEPCRNKIYKQCERCKENIPNTRRFSNVNVCKQCYIVVWKEKYYNKNNI